MKSGPQSQKIQKLFNDLAHRYDKGNQWITLGLGKSWKKKLIQWSEAKPGDQILDCATGTGDLIISYFEKLEGHGKFIGTDFSEKMLEQARLKNYPQIEFQWADASELKFEDQSFDIVSISYGLRNIKERAQAISDMSRVLKPGGQLMILETGDSPYFFMRPFLNFYNSKVMPLLGGFVSKQGDSYRYLSDSTQSFPSGQDLCQSLKEFGSFSQVEYKTILGGASFLYKAKKV